MVDCGFRVVAPSAQGIGIAEVRQTLRKGFPAIRQVMMYVGARPVPLLITAALENLSYKIGGESYDALASRVAYLETGLLSIASLIFNFILGVGSLGLVVVTLGQMSCCKEIFKKQWVHTAIAVCAVGISVLGCISPLVGIVATGGLLSLLFTQVYRIWQNLKLPEEKEQIAIVQMLYQQHANDVQEAFSQLGIEAEQIQAMLENMERIIESASSLENLFVNALRSFLQSSIKKETAS